MVRLLAFAAAALVALASPITVAASVVNFPKGVYYRPFSFEVSGRVDATTPYVRSPCPALNSMANHGFIPRNGKALTRVLLKTAVMEAFNLDGGLADVMVGLTPDTPTFSLATLSTHNLIEHDVSLSRRDAYFGGDPAVADTGYLFNMLGYGFLDGSISLKDLAKIRAVRHAECVAKNPKCDYGDQQQFVASAESGLMLRAMGGKNSESVSYGNAYSFFVNEKFPMGFVNAPEPITFYNITATIANLAAVVV